ncbi:hypothetical protein HBI56_166610 [Parastagonospora nodorum]|nr:hypothetical protein HBH56_074370 [Parastagonospora nodorum]KAH3927222.1 hypothetical protein HBH54_154610 [Parastagonospora nodorum]KAH3981755.1 hypothetical protein HBH51_041360 [Parastagonospora nodorum]KAH3983002.1 hypothetical protein HBH52_068970 [Parastagonospora nodorum]KAH3994803.1 hypothetical protein HBI10_181260 [Parastagonospora nodorum]
MPVRNMNVSLSADRHSTFATTRFPPSNFCDIALLFWADCRQILIPRLERSLLVPPILHHCPSCVLVQTTCFCFCSVLGVPSTLRTALSVLSVNGRLAACNSLGQLRTLTPGTCCLLLYN